MVAEILAGIALVKASVSAVKTSISTINDIGEISGQISGALSGQRDCAKARSKDKGMSIRQQFGSDSPAQAVIDAKLAAELVNELKFLVIDRFDLKTWDMIVEAEREKVQQDAAAARAQKIAKAENQEQMQEIAVVGASLAIGILIIVGIGLVMWAMEVK
jgi:CHASE3 domain sensor protein